MAFFFIHYEGQQQARWFSGDQATCGTLQEAAKEAGPGQNIIILIPGERVSLHNARVPGSRQQAMQAAPFVIEEQLADEPEDLHFALGPRDGNDSWPVAVVGREYMREIFIGLSGASVRAGAIIPDILALPLTAGEWTIWRDGQWLKIRTGVYSGCVVEMENFCWLIKNLLEKCNVRPRKLNFMGENCQSVDLPDDLPNGIQTNFANTIPKWCLNRQTNAYDRGRTAKPDINLIQGEYSPDRQWRKIWHNWRLPAALLGIVIMLYGAALFARGIRLRNESHSLATSITNIYRQTFPQARHIVNPRIQMQQQLDKLTTDRQNTFSALLTAFYPALRGGGKLRVTELQFHDRQLEIHLSGGDINDMDAARKRAASSFNGKVKLYNVSTDGRGAQATMILTQ